MSGPAEFPICPYCNEDARLVKGKKLWPLRPDLADKDIYICEPCHAWVGCHPGTFTPLGTLANAELRRARHDAHECFDPLWQAKLRRDNCSKSDARNAGYDWLAAQLGMKREDCHIGMMDLDHCHRVIEVCRLTLEVAKRKAALAQPLK